MINDFIVHDVQVCSSHAPIQVNFTISCDNVYNESTYEYTDALKYDRLKSNYFIEQISNHVDLLNSIVQQISNSSVSVNAGVDLLSKTFYDVACKVFGTSTRVVQK